MSGAPVLPDASRAAPAISARAEAPLTLTRHPARVLGFWPQCAMWGSFGVTLFGPLTGALVTESVGSLPGGLLACAIGTLIAALLLGGAAAIGARLGTPSMVGLRGMLGHRASIVPTVLNIAQNIGWATMEIVVISSAAAAIAGPAWRWPFVVAAGAAATVMSVRPLGTVTFLRTVMLWLVIAGSVYLFVMVLRQPAHPIAQDEVAGLWPGVDLAAAQVVSFAPLAADYSRHSTSGRAAFGSASLGYGLAIFGYYCLGVVAVGHLGGDVGGTHLLGALMALPAGAIAVALLLTDEVDDAFADIYSAAVSVHNIAPGIDRRTTAIIMGVVSTALAGVLDFDQYESFLYLIGSAFVPLFAVAVVDFFWVSGGRWDTSSAATFRWPPALAWLLGFVAYQLIQPGSVPGWSALWAAIRRAAGVHTPGWVGSTLGSMVVAGASAWLLGQLANRLTHPGHRLGASARAHRD
ncbi:putative hydroxymethylpyrimidine transporter CytX [Propionibacterium cyclohexanicum]|uniref:Putative hydroxymethylpyrimidine transporter CytX n=1 Tax=Propionibacterium cyclohexanicum TaxID=64702 RepID=A0A1H9RUR4_9ACTN|nr:cytosine permease [Propionibacterium cyclohexanicum]SER76298.1 putative hydroxymethylpyrimidine transporter CytX [Propionibacterium cyclohexanicum]